MTTQREKAMRDFKRMMKVIVAVAVLMVIGALAFIGMTSDLTIHMVIAIILGVFFSVLLGTGLFALAFLSDKSGHDEAVTGATTRSDRREP